MTEKVMLSVILLLCAIIGYFVRELLHDIKGTQKDHTTSLRNLRDHTLKIEERTNTLGNEITQLRELSTANATLQRETRSTLDHTLTEIRHQIKAGQDEQARQKQEFGKVTLIVHKLFTRLNGGGGK